MPCARRAVARFESLLTHGVRALRVPDLGGQRLKADFGMNAAVGHEDAGSPSVKKRKPRHPSRFTSCEIPPCSPSMTFLQTRQTVGPGMFAHFDADVATAHFVGHGRRRAGAEKAVEYEVTGVGGDTNDALD